MHDIDGSIDAITLQEKRASSAVEDVPKCPLRRPDASEYPSSDISGYSAFTQCEIEVEYPPKPPIQCIYSGKDLGDPIQKTPALIFTHGAGGTLKSDAIVNFTHGFVTTSARPTLLCFRGNMNLPSRVKMFRAIIEARKTISTSPCCLGGRSMGARAAIMAATEDTTHLVLVSYPLHTGKETRDQILLDLPLAVKVIFVSGERDDMCDLERLETVRHKMKCKTWRIVVQGADHGMNVKPKSATQDVGRMTGALVATWLGESDEHLTEGTISGDAGKASAQWSGWSGRERSLNAAATSTEASIKPKKPTVKLSGTKKSSAPSANSRPKSSKRKHVEGEQHLDRDKASKPKKRRKT